MRVTSDTLFHFTKPVQNLNGILENGFQLTYCNEKYDLGDQHHEYYYPMVSFCDIPLIAAKKHIENYGSFAIGMNKQWGIKNHLNPVVYIETSSYLAKDIQATIDNGANVISSLSDAYQKRADEVKKGIDHIASELRLYADNIKINYDQTHILNEINKVREMSLDRSQYLKGIREIISRFSEMIDSTGSIFRYIKNYQGTLERNNRKIENYRFYDEREWRFVPALDNKVVKYSLTKSEFSDYRGKSKVKPFIKGIHLPVKAEDIKYLIVKSDRDIPGLIKKINAITNLYKNTDEAAVLTTRIMTVDQLNDDF